MITHSELASNTPTTLADIDGCILAFGRLDQPMRQVFIDKQIPYIFLNRIISGDESYISCNHSRGLETTTAHLFAKGHRQIGYLGCHAKEVNRDRFKGFAAAAFEATGSIPTANITSVAQTDDIDLATARFFLDRNCTAVACFNDSFAIRLIQQLQSLGLSVPDDLSVTGFDNSYLRNNFQPLITTINLSVYDMAFYAGQWLHDTIINRQSRVIHLEIDGQLIEGTSVKKLV